MTYVEPDFLFLFEERGIVSVHYQIVIPVDGEVLGIKHHERGRALFKMTT